MILLSIIVPVYNTSSYIRKCILSILDQPVDRVLYEVIIVNDGSTDDSAFVLNQLQQEYSFLKIIHQENRGLGGARNEGMMHASGDYILLLDSDDFLFPNKLLPLIEASRTKNTQILGFGWSEVFSSGKQKEVKRLKELYDMKMSGADYLKNYNLVGGACFYLFSASLLKKHNLDFEEEIYHEDELFLPKAFTYAESVSFADINVYAYFQRSNSITRNRDIDSLNKRLDDSVFVIKSLLEFSADKSLSGDQKIGLKRKINFLTVDLIINMVRMNLSNDVLRGRVKRLRDLGVYPLPSAQYSFKYTVFRSIFNKESLLWLTRKSIF